MRQEEKAPIPPVHSELEITPIWSWSGYSADSESVETPQRDSASFVMNSGVQQHKVCCLNNSANIHENVWVKGKVDLKLCYFLFTDMRFNMF